MVSSINPTNRLRVIETSGLTLTEFTQPPSFQVSRHFHECATVFFIIRGFAADCITGRMRECNPLDVLIRPAGENHTHHYGHAGAHCMVLEIKPGRHAHLKVFSPILDRVGHFKDSLLSDLVMRLYAESRVMDNASELAIEGLTLEMMAHLTRENQKNNASTQPHWLRWARDFIQEAYTQTLSLSQVAATVGVHPAHLAEVFRKHYGCTVGQYIRQLRLDYAAREVMLSDKSLAEISATAGFYDQSHFTKLFKRRIGKSPAVFRRLVKTPKSRTKSLQLSKPT